MDVAERAALDRHIEAEDEEDGQVPVYEDLTQEEAAVFNPGPQPSLAQGDVAAAIAPLCEIIQDIDSVRSKLYRLQFHMDDATAAITELTAALAHVQNLVGWRASWVYRYGDPEDE